MLLSHRAGLPPHHRFFRATLNGLPLVPDRVLRFCLDNCSSGEKSALYSDLGYILAGEILAQIHKKSLSELLALALPQNLARKIGSARDFRNWLGPEAFQSSVVATEPSPARGQTLKGVVHDHNCWAIAGRDWSGHAGLFSGANSLLDLGAHLISGATGEGIYGKFLPSFLALRPGGSFRIGFDGTSTSGSQAGRSASRACFGHLGFTGTSIWVDHELNAASVLLTNRVSADWDPSYIRRARTKLHGLGFSLARSTAKT